MLYVDYYTAEQLHKLRQAEIDRAIRSGLFVKHDEMPTDPRRRRQSFLLMLLHKFKL